MWILGTLAASIAFVDPLKSFLPVQAVVGIVIAPLVIALVGEALDDESHSERSQRIGMWMQISGALSLLGISFTSLILMQNQSFNDKWMFYVMVLAGLIPLSVLTLDCYLGLFKKQRLRLPDSAATDNWTAIGISIFFVVCVVAIVIFKNSAINPALYGVGLFFSMCAAICLNTWWINHELSGKPKTPCRRTIFSFDLTMLIGGAAGAALVIKSLIDNGRFVSSYDVVVGALFSFLGLIFAILKVGKALRRWSSFVATRDGLLELHSCGTILYRWENIDEAFLVNIAASSMAIAITLNVDLPAVEPQMQPGLDNTAREKWQRKYRERWVTNKHQYQADLLIIDGRCLYGIVNLWDAIRLVLADDTQRMNLPPTSSYTSV